MKKAVIIGAGQTGRGFIAPILIENGYHLVFIDKNHTLLKQLQEKASYRITYFGNAREDVEIKGYEAYAIDSEQAIRAIAEADVVFTSVFAGNIKNLVEPLRKAVARRNKSLTVICCENGIHVKKPLEDQGLNAIISEGIIFCTTHLKGADTLDVLCEDVKELPVDGSVPGLCLDIKGMPLEHSFSVLIQRKIYTYNFISAAIAYLGWYKRYDVYADAANDKEIAGFIDDVVPLISDLVAKEYKIEYEEQLQFTKKAVMKFRNRNIADTIYRNSHQADRKLEDHERLLFPLKLAINYHADTKKFEQIIAAAMAYGTEKEGLCKEKVLSRIRRITKDEGVVESIENYFMKFIEKQDLSNILI